MILRANKFAIMQAAKDKHSLKSGGICHTTKKWKSCKKHYLANEKVIAGAFKKFFLKGLKKMINKSELKIPPQLGYLDMSEANLLDFVSKLCDKNWKANVQLSEGDEVHVAKYLTGYQRRSPLSNRRILKIENKMVTFQYKDYKNKNLDAVKTVTAERFVRLFANHIPEKRTYKSSNLHLILFMEKTEHAKQVSATNEQIVLMQKTIDDVQEWMNDLFFHFGINL